MHKNQSSSVGFLQFYILTAKFGLKDSKTNIVKTFEAVYQYQLVFLINQNPRMNV